MATRPAPPSALFATVLALTTAMGPLSLHMFFPATPAVRADLGIDASFAQLTVSVPMFTMAFLTLVYGSLSDRYGRRPVMLGGIALFVAGGLLAAVTESVWLLIAARLVQAAGGACGVSLARVIARDVYGTDRLVKVIAYLLMAYSLGPMIAPPIGGFLVDGWGWRSVLVFACVIGALIGALVALVLHETHPPENRLAVRRSFLSDYRQLFSSLRFSAFVLQSGFTSAVFFTMATASSFLMKDYLGRPASEYGLYFMMFPVGYWLGTFTSTRLSGRVAIETMVLSGALILTLAVGGMTAVMLAGAVAPLVIFIPGFLVTYAQGIALPNAQAGAIGSAGELAGTASGIGVFLQMFGAGLFSQAYGVLADGTPVPMLLVTGTATALSLATGIVPFTMARKNGPV